jgi:ribonucleoside-triphosphate reductase
MAAQNAASGSEVDANSNVSNKNIATMAPEIHKKANIFTNRLAMYDRLTELYGRDIAEKYLDQLEKHEIYRHDESGMPVGTPYCASITLYPFLFDGMTKLGGTTTAPHHLKSFCGGFINLVFAVSAQLA